MRLLSFDPAGLGGDVGWATADTSTKEVKFGAVKRDAFKLHAHNLLQYDLVISEKYVAMFNNGDEFVIKKFNEQVQNACSDVPFKEVMPSVRLNVPDSVIRKISVVDHSHHKDAESALRHALVECAKHDFNFNLYLMNDLEPN